MLALIITDLTNSASNGIPKLEASYACISVLAHICTDFFEVSSRADEDPSRDKYVCCGQAAQ
jgi:hypothetical protein